MRWDGALEDRKSVQETYIDLIAKRRELDWASAEVVECNVDGARLTLTIAVDGRFYLGEFIMDGDASDLDAVTDTAEVHIKSDDGRWQARITCVA